MPRIPLPAGFEGSEDLPQTNRSLQNCFNNLKERIIARPGITQLNTTDSLARGQFVWNGDLYQVVSTDLIKITNTTTGAFIVIGTIPGNAVIETAIGFNDAVIVVKAVAGDIFTLSNSTTQIAITGVTDNGGIASFTHAGTTPAVGNTVTLSSFVVNTAYNITGIVTASTATTFEISSISFGSDETGQFTLVLANISGNSNFVACTDVAHINGRFVYIPFDGDPAFFSDVGAAGTVQVLSFFDAEELPDLNNSVFNFKNTLYIGGTDSFELFRDTGASPNPFQRIEGARIINGFIGGLIEYNETFLFVGREKDQDFGIYAIGQGFAPKISNERIDLILSTYDQDELAAAIGGRLKWRGYDIATFKFARDSFGYYAGNWFILDTVFDGVSKPWGGGFISQFEGQYFTAFEDKIGVFAKVNTDYGNSITRRINTAFEQEDNDFFTCQSIDLGISQGFSSTDGSVALFLSRDNVTFGQPLFRELGVLGAYDTHLIWNEGGGLGSFDGFMGVEIYTTEDVEFNIDHLIANFRG